MSAAGIAAGVVPALAGVAAGAFIADRAGGNYFKGADAANRQKADARAQLLRIEQQDIPTSPARMAELQRAAHAYHSLHPGLTPIAPLGGVLALAGGIVYGAQAVFADESPRFASTFGMVGAFGAGLAVGSLGMAGVHWVRERR